ncbi:MAG TPA: hypothetical protein VN673_19110 [Clostridia bacterium]|nr:hypothetical protein [Clostridia bacterium]
MKKQTLTLNTRHFHLLPILALAALLAAGCTTVSYHGPGGERFTRTALGARTAITSLSVEAGTNGVRRLDLRGYQHDSAQALGVVTEAAVRAALTGK